MQNGEKQAGVCLLYTVQKMDAGPGGYCEAHAVQWDFALTQGLLRCSAMARCTDPNFL